MTGTSWTIEEYNAVPDPPEAPIPAAPIPTVPINALPPIAEGDTDEATIEEGGAAIEEGETDEATIGEGGTDFVCKGLLLFLCLVIFPRARIPISPFPFSYCFDLLF